MSKNLLLTIELVPASSWNNNLRSILKPQMWKEIREQIYTKNNFRCLICKASGKLHAHEVWEYDDKNHIQRLKDIIPLCNLCHAIKHLGHTELVGHHNLDDLIKHFIKVNSSDKETFNRHRKEEFNIFQERSKFDWGLDLSDYRNKLGK